MLHSFTDMATVGVKGSTSNMSPEALLTYQMSHPNHQLLA